MMGRDEPMTTARAEEAAAVAIEAPPGIDCALVHPKCEMYPSVCTGI